MNHSDDDLRQAIALFRYGVIADLVHLPVGTKGTGAMMRAKARQTYTIPGTERTRVAAATIGGWVRLYRDGGFDALYPKPRTDRGQPRRLAPVTSLRAGWLAHLDARAAHSLQTLNRSLWAWIEGEYHHSAHRGLDGRTPLEQWALASAGVRYPDATLERDGSAPLNEAHSMHTESVPETLDIENLTRRGSPGASNCAGRAAPGRDESLCRHFPKGCESDCGEGADHQSVAIPQQGVEDADDEQRGVPPQTRPDGMRHSGWPQVSDPPTSSSEHRTPCLSQSCPPSLPRCHPGTRQPPNATSTSGDAGTMTHVPRGGMPPARLLRVLFRAPPVRRYSS